MIKNRTAQDVIEIIKGHYYLCPQIKEDLCTTWWLHDGCESLRALLLDLTHEDRFSRKDLDSEPHIVEELKQMFGNEDFAKLLENLKNQNK